MSLLWLRLKEFVVPWISVVVPIIQLYEQIVGACFILCGGWCLPLLSVVHLTWGLWCRSKHFKESRNHKFFQWMLICVHFHRHEIMLADLPTEIDNYHELCPLKPVPTNPMHKSQLLGYPTSTYKATNTKTGVRYCLRRVHGEEYCWKKYNSRNMKVCKTLETIVCLYATFIPYLPECKMALI